jgi:hypothetical protein
VTIVKTNHGRPSKYDNNIPYAYKARYRYIDAVEDYNCYISDTVCGLIPTLKILGYDPQTVDLYEKHWDREIKITPHLYTRGGNWMSGNELCQSFKKIYPDHISSNSCKFDDRNSIWRAP